MARLIRQSFNVNDAGSPGVNWSDQLTPSTGYISLFDSNTEFDLMHLNFQVVCTVTNKPIVVIKQDQLSAYVSYVDSRLPDKDRLKDDGGGSNTVNFDLYQSFQVGTNNLPGKALLTGVNAFTLVVPVPFGLLQNVGYAITDFIFATLQASVIIRVR